MWISDNVLFLQYRTCYVSKDVYVLEIGYDRKFKMLWMHGPCFHFVCSVDVWIG